MYIVNNLLILEEEWILPKEVDNLFILACDLSMPPTLSLELLSDWLDQAKSEKVIWTIKFSYHPSGQREDLKRYEVLTIVRNMISHYPKYTYTIKTLYNHGEEMVIFGHRLETKND